MMLVLVTFDENTITLFNTLITISSITVTTATCLPILEWQQQQSYHVNMLNAGSVLYKHQAAMCPSLESDSITRLWSP